MSSVIENQSENHYLSPRRTYNAPNITYKTDQLVGPLSGPQTPRRHDLCTCKDNQFLVTLLSISNPLSENPAYGPVDGYRNSKRMAINGMVKRLCKEEDVGYVDLWDSFVGKEEMYLRDGLHLSGKGAAVFAEGLSGAVASGLGKVRYLN